MEFIAPDPDTLLPKLRDLVREKVFVGDLTLTIVRPDRSDKLLDHPEVHEAFRKDEYMPYWAEIWPAARMLAKILIREPLEGAEIALELGCGLGVAGLVALSRGLEVVFSDYDACALKFVADNALANGYDRFRTRQLDFRDPPTDLRVPLVIGSDLIYEARKVEPLIGCLKAVLLPGGRALLTDQDRIPTAVFQAALREAGFTVTTQPTKAGEPGGLRRKGTLYRVHRPA
jgi:predicted nicotinamide N-methyase